MTATEEWVDSLEHPGYRVKVVKRGNCTINILRPILSDTERAKREAQIKAVAEKTLADYFIRKETERK